jgi:hypothetical protein
MKIHTLMLTLLAVTVACSPTDDSPATETAIPLENSTATSEIISPSSTPILLEDSNNFISTNSPTIVPLQTSTPYPTFEVKNVNTHIPFQPAQCPPENPNYELSTNISRETFNPSELVEIVKHELDNGASFAQAKQEIEKALLIPGVLEIEDLTGDSVPELAIYQIFGMVVFGCDNGDYKTILDYSTIFDGGSSPSIFAVQDMNLNRIPDVVLAYSATSGGNTVVDILEWDGIQFNSLIQANHGENSSGTSHLAKALYWYSSSFHNWSNSDSSNTPVMEGRADVVINDIDQNGTKELILTDNGPGHWDTLFNFGPWRGKQVIFKWDGIHYLYSSLEIDPPVFQFQAVQDADRLFLLGEYDKALKLYLDVIFSDKLEWWSPEKMTFIRDSYFAKVNGDATPIPPQSNNAEYLSLAAYARFRILLHHISRGSISDANTAYTTLIENFPEGTTGSQFADMATILWSEYQKTNSLEQSCQPVIDYVKSHPEILSPLGNDKHGFQSHIYVAEDVCPLT